MEGRFVTAAEGIVDDDVDKSIRNLTSIGAKCNELQHDEMVLNIYGEQKRLLSTCNSYLLVS